MNVGSAFNGGGVPVRLRHRRRPGSRRHGGRAASAKRTAAARLQPVPKTGGNTFNGTVFGNLAGDGRRATTWTTSSGPSGSRRRRRSSRLGHQRFAGRADRAGQAVVLRRRSRLFGNYTDVAGRFGNLNAGDPTKWPVHRRSLPFRQRSATSRKIVGGRVTSQLTQRQKVSAFYDFQAVCEGSAYSKDGDFCRARGDDWIAVGGFGTWSPEATRSRDHPEHLQQILVFRLGNEPAADRMGHSRSSPATGADRRRPARSIKEPFVPVQERSIAGGVPIPNMLYHGFDRPEQQPSVAQRVAYVVVLRVRRAQHEGGLSGGLRSDRHLR